MPILTCATFLYRLVKINGILLQLVVIVVVALLLNMAIVRKTQTVFKRDKHQLLAQASNSV